MYFNKWHEHFEIVKQGTGRITRYFTQKKEKQREKNTLSYKYRITQTHMRNVKCWGSIHFKCWISLT